MTTKNVVGLYHGGDLGDTIYAIPVLRRLADPAHLTLYPNYGVTRAIMDEHNASMILPLLNIQQGITADWKPDFGDSGLRLDFGVRRFYKNSFNLADMMSNWLGHDHWNREQPWLTVDKIDATYKIVVARSARYRQKHFPWKRLYQEFNGRACFIGVPWEHENFEEEVGKIDYAFTPTLLEAARLIAGSDLFIGNQSCPLALANSLAHPSIVEQGHPANCHFSRESVWYPWGYNDPVPELDDQTLSDNWCAAAAARSVGMSSLSSDNLLALARACRLSRLVLGECVEVGVAHGGSAAVISWATMKKLHLCDIFDGNPATANEAKWLLRVYNKEFHVGRFPQNSMPNGPFSFAHIDLVPPGDTAVSVDWLLPRMSPNGILAIKKYAGTGRAIFSRKIEIREDAGYIIAKGS